MYDAVNNLIDPWHRNAAGLVAIVGRQLVTQKNFKIINQHSQQNPNMELMAGNELMKLSSVGGIPSVQVPYFPDGAVLITTMKNLSIYWQKGKLNRFIKMSRNITVLPPMHRVMTVMPWKITASPA